MARSEAKKVKAYRLKTKEVVCPHCISQTEKADPMTNPVIEDVIHDEPAEMACPVCGTGGKAATGPASAKGKRGGVSGPEDAIHDSGPLKCVRCQTRIA